jgi:hypothetical protein
MRAAPYVLVFLAALGLVAYLVLGNRSGDDALDDADGRAAPTDEAGEALLAPDLEGVRGATPWTRRVASCWTRRGTCRPRGRPSTSSPRRTAM